MRFSHRTAFGIGTLALAGLLSAGSAHAQVTEYTSRAAFQAVAPSLTTFTFDGDAPAGGLTEYPNGITVQGVTFVGSAGRSIVVTSPQPVAEDPFNGHQFLTDGSNPDGITVSALPIGTTAFGLDVACFRGSDKIAVTADGQTFDVFAGSRQGSPVFIGFTSAAPLTGLSFTQIENDGFGVVLDNVSVGPAPVPEASTTISFGLLLCLGLGGLAVSARRRKAQVGK